MSGLNFSFIFSVSMTAYYDEITSCPDSGHQKELQGAEVLG